jgi:hypothetical protein
MGFNFLGHSVTGETTVQSVFLMDQRQRERVRLYGDVMALDGTSMTNVRGFSLMALVGKDANGHLITFGFCLLDKEKCGEAVSWLGQKFCEAAGDAWDRNAPHTIFTDKGFQTEDLLSGFGPVTHLLCHLAYETGSAAGI